METDNLILEQLRLLRGDIDEIKRRLLRVELDVELELGSAGIDRRAAQTSYDQINKQLGLIKQRLNQADSLDRLCERVERIERRLDLAGTQQEH